MAVRMKNKKRTDIGSAPPESCYRRNSSTVPRRMTHQQVVSLVSAILQVWHFHVVSRCKNNEQQQQLRDNSHETAALFQNNQSSFI
jgi:hypothetical protein